MVSIQGFIDHFENDVAAIFKSDRTIALVPRRSLPMYAHPGDYIVEVNDKRQFIIDRKITELRRREICRMSDNFFG
jgi:hypothetical protein